MRINDVLARTLPLIVISIALAACSVLEGGAAPSPTASPAASASEEPEPSVESVGGITIVDCTFDAATDPDCAGQGLRVKQPVAVGEQVRLSIRFKNVSDEPVGPISIHAIESSASVPIVDILPVAGCSKPCDHSAINDGEEILAEFQAMIDPQKAVTYTLVLTAKQVGEHSIDVAVFAKPMADVETSGSDPDQIASWIGVLVTVTE